MKHAKGLFFVATAAAALLFGGAAAIAQSTAPCYTLASLEGNYAVVGDYGANVALALGERTLDGKGNLTGTFTLNAPTAGSTTGARTITTGKQEGTYTVNCNGTGVITRTLTSNGKQIMQEDDFVITGGKWIDGQLIATAIKDAQTTPSALVAGGIFVTRVWTRLPTRFGD